LFRTKEQKTWLAPSKSSKTYARENKRQDGCRLALVDDEEACKKAEHVALLIAFKRSFKKMNCSAATPYVPRVSMAT